MQSELIESVRALAFKRKLRRESVRYTRVALTDKVRAFIADPRNHEYCVIAPEGCIGANIRDAHDQFYEAARDFDFPALLAALERAERIEALLKRGTQAGISNYPNQFVHFSYEDGQEIAALSEPQ